MYSQMDDSVSVCHQRNESEYTNSYKLLSKLHMEYVI